MGPRVVHAEERGLCRIEWNHSLASGGGGGTSESDSFPGQTAVESILKYVSDTRLEFYWMVKPFCVVCGLILVYC